jgi:hypothetical protein
MLLLITHHTQVSFTVAIHNFMSLGSGSHAKPKQTVNKQRIIVHFSCQEREKKEKTQTINH